MIPRSGTLMYIMAFHSNHPWHAPCSFLIRIGKYGVRSPKFIWAPCAQLYSLAEPLPPPPLHRIWAHIRGRYWSAKIDSISLWPPAPPPFVRKSESPRVCNLLGIKLFSLLFFFLFRKRVFLPSLIFSFKKILSSFAIFFFPIHFRPGRIPHSKFCFTKFVSFVQLQNSNKMILFVFMNAQDMDYLNV